jgi:hypothetical protein
MLRLVPGVEREPSKFTICSTSGVCGVKANNETVGMGIVVVVVVGIDVVVSVIFTTPGPTGGSLLHANANRASNGMATSSSLRITTWSG